MALEDLVVVIVGDAALVLATLVLARHTKVLARNTGALYKETSVLTQIEKKRDLTRVLSERIEVAENLTVLEPILITTYLGGVGMRATPGVADAAAWVRRLRTLLPKNGDPDLPDLIHNLDVLIIQLDNADAGGGISTESEKDVSKSVENLKGRLKNLLPRWRKELQALYGE